jgi:hypothetical protein
MFVRERRRFVADSRKNFEGDFLSSKCSLITGFATAVPQRDRVNAARSRRSRRARSLIRSVASSAASGATMSERFANASTDGALAEYARAPLADRSGSIAGPAEDTLDGGRMRKLPKRDTIAGGCLQGGHD